MLLEKSDHLFGKPGNVREFDNCQGNVGTLTKSHGHVAEKTLLLTDVWDYTSVLYDVGNCSLAGRGNFSACRGSLWNYATFC